MTFIRISVMLKFKPNPEFAVPATSITPQWAFRNRRAFLRGGAAGALAWASRGAWAGPLKHQTNQAFTKIEAPRELTKKNLALSYNNFYEFSLDKGDVAPRAKDWTINSWSLEVGGLVKKPRVLKLADLTTAFPLEERTYRHRCVEAWSMVLPWTGFSLATLLDSVEPKADARYVKFTSLADPVAMPNIKARPEFGWPYVEGLRLDEARNPLTFLAVGLYGESLEKQNGAPIRLVVPWKYGFKGIKSIVKIELIKERPVGLWEHLASGEYSFYANVNPKVDHPRWSQASERVIDGKLFPKRIPTLMFNGYESYVAKLYDGLDLKKNF